jgi:uncharacterized protein
LRPARDRFSVAVMAGFCVGCGMCCDGTLYSSVGMDDTPDLQPLVELGARFVHDAKEVGGRSLVEPCPAFCDGCCSIYEVRPTACRAYSCTLLHRYEQGHVTYAEAEELIRQTTAVRDRVRPAAERLARPTRPEPMAAVVSDAFDVIKASPDPEAAMAEHADLIRDAGLLMALLRTHFKTKRRRIRHELRDVLRALEPAQPGVYRRRVSRAARR